MHTEGLPRGRQVAPWPLPRSCVVCTARWPDRRRAPGHRPARAGSAAWAPRGRTADRPTAVVSLGDSAISGEGAGAYEPGTDGPVATTATARRTRWSRPPSIAGIQARVNMACSGAASSDVRIGGTSHYTEPSQAEQLRAVAAAYDVKLLVLQVGANDEPAFADSVLTCIEAWANPFAPGLPRHRSARCGRAGWPRWRPGRGGHRRPAHGDARGRLRRRGVPAGAAVLRVAVDGEHALDTHGVRGLPDPDRRRPLGADRGGRSGCPPRCAGWPRGPGCGSWTSARATEGREACTAGPPLELVDHAADHRRGRAVRVR